ncbi:hydantoinase/carbamoylase family amidase [Luteolibacter sp. GHJ8]|uniref:Hydantoinase/carbamoylase family amidase n=1 Tax=Luteolibacter rhizosphaerae TaxID=2989719 RepID=A0ABT3FZS8_9BACT|nr:hydantoinase/carbamoylase family amidase [Luteolibacter rhizosphaerae]MCW1912834.1 hydantoinase/carbamoylase family amidase [Luteolibacter rhizosphaerae]
MGSHLDTVIDAGKYDGALGVLMAIAALEVTGPLGFPVHVLGFSDEEGVRFHATYLGSRACVGELTREVLEMRDAYGISVGEVLECGVRSAEEFASVQCSVFREEGEGGVPSDQLAVISEKAGEQGEAGMMRVEEFHYAPGECRGYVEVHIEQGRVLEELGEAVCGVSGICGQSRLMLSLRGQADHAGTTPMEIRRDALAGACECVLAVEAMGRRQPPLVATVGKMDIRPGASNAIPGEVRFTLDFRHPVDAVREALLGELLGILAGIAESRGLELGWEMVQENGAVPCDADLREALLDAVEAVTGSRRELPSGAGHDGVMMATAMPVGMVFVRCRGGLSHHPEEYAAPEDVAVGLRVLVGFLRSGRW